MGWTALVSHCLCSVQKAHYFSRSVRKPVMNRGEGPLLLKVGPEGRKGHHRSALPLARSQLFWFRSRATRLSCWLLPSMPSAAPAARHWSQADYPRTCFFPLGFPCVASYAAACEVRAVPFWFSFTSYPRGDFLESF